MKKRIFTSGDCTQHEQEDRKHIELDHFERNEKIFHGECTAYDCMSFDCSVGAITLVAVNFGGEIERVVKIMQRHEASASGTCL